MAMGWALSYRPAMRHPAALAAVLAAVLPAAACTAGGPAEPSAAPAASGAPASGAPAGGHWEQAVPVPGLAGRGLNAGGQAGVSSVSCVSAGNCTIGGSYRDSHNHGQAYVASERNGRWGTAIEIPGTARLNAGGAAGADSVSCPAAGNCTISGGYADRHGHGQVFVASEQNGRWGTAIEIPGTARLNAQQIGDTSVSCASAGNCAARGFYTDGQRHAHLFVVSKRNGRWGAAAVVPGTVGGVRAGVYSLWCDNAGNCVAGGVYSGRQGGQQAFVASERNARWAAAVNVLRASGLNAASAWVTSVSCAGAGNCAAGGSYTDGHGHSLVFVAGERNGRWGTAIEIPGTARLNAGRYPQVSSVSCLSAGNCAAGGWYVDSSHNRHAFVVSERNGRWGTAIEIPGTRARSWVNSVSCGRAGNCVADGGYIGGPGGIRPFVAGEQDGRWAAAEVPGIAGLISSVPGHGGNTEVSGTSCLNGYCVPGAISCLRSGYCLAGGYYDDYFGHRQAFVAARR
jgi:hypothetical protein